MTWTGSRQQSAASPPPPDTTRSPEKDSKECPWKTSRNEESISQARRSAEQGAARAARSGAQQVRRAAAHMKCPKCGADLQEREFHHVKVDACPNARECGSTPASRHDEVRQPERIGRFGGRSSGKSCSGAVPRPGIGNPTALVAEHGYAGGIRAAARNAGREPTFTSWALCARSGASTALQALRPLLRPCHQGTLVLQVR